MKMRIPLITLWVGLLLVAQSAWCSVRTIEPIVSTDWLAGQLDDPNLIILDVRLSPDYQSGHIPGAVSEPFVVPFSAWIVMKDDLLLELPEDDELFTTIGHLGITLDSRVVVVSAPNAGEPPHYGMAAATRVASTLIYAGVANVAVLDGGYGKWLAEQLPVATSASAPVAVEFEGDPLTDMFVSQTYVLRNAWRSKLLDARDANIYFGDAVEPFAEDPGHIYSASSLPAPWAYALDAEGNYLFKDRAVLEGMAKGVVGWHAKKKEVIVYCGVGGYTSVWWYLLREVLGYKKVKYYDGSAQEWARDYDMVPYIWQ